MVPLPTRLRSGTSPEKARAPSTIVRARAASSAVGVVAVGVAAGVPARGPEAEPADWPTSSRGRRAPSGSTASATRRMSAGVCWPSASAVTTAAPGHARAA
ncbi:hypothetical protein [Microbacterium hominis]|uniref:hypothetical protein n=1 Tax=Microbacterium hominis TaxID=162426 RepID=UPI001CC303EE|nr:hypothetical protein [Microbacterium hominis]